MTGRSGLLWPQSTGHTSYNRSTCPHKIQVGPGLVYTHCQFLEDKESLFPESQNKVQGSGAPPGPVQLTSGHDEESTAGRGRTPEPLWSFIALVGFLMETYICENNEKSKREPGKYGLSNALWLAPGQKRVQEKGRRAQGGVGEADQCECNLRRGWQGTEGQEREHTWTNALAVHRLICMVKYVENGGGESERRRQQGRGGGRAGFLLPVRQGPQRMWAAQAEGGAHVASVTGLTLRV